MTAKNEQAKKLYDKLGLDDEEFKIHKSCPDQTGGKVSSYLKRRPDSTSGKTGTQYLRLIRRF